MSGGPSAYGFGVRAERPVQLLRHDGAEDTIEVGVLRDQLVEPDEPPLVEWNFRDAPGISASLYRHGSEYSYWQAGGSTIIDPERRRVQLPPVANTVLWEEHLWGVPALLCFLERGDLPLHAAAVEFGAGAVLLAAPGMHGKTTLAVQLHVDGHRVLGEDLACCRLGGGGAHVLPGPALLRVRPDVLPPEQVPDVDVVFRHPQRVYLGIRRSRRGSGLPVPIAAVVLLHVNEGKVRAEPVDPAAALPDLWGLSFKLPGAEARSTAFRNIARLARNVPLWNIYRPLTQAGLLDSIATIERIAIGDGEQ